MKYLSLALIVMLSFAACHDREEDHNMPSDAGGVITDSNNTGNLPDTTARNVQDTSTSVGYDTSSRR
jgi:hypothetical protein